MKIDRVVLPPVGLPQPNTRPLFKVVAHDRIVLLDYLIKCTSYLPAHKADRRFRYMRGLPAFLRFPGPPLAKAEHPFALSSEQQPVKKSGEIVQENIPIPICGSFPDCLNQPQPVVDKGFVSLKTSLIKQEKCENTNCQILIFHPASQLGAGTPTPHCSCWPSAASHYFSLKWFLTD